PSFPATPAEGTAPAPRTTVCVRAGPARVGAADGTGHGFWHYAPAGSRLRAAPATASGCRMRHPPQTTSAGRDAPRAASAFAATAESPAPLRVRFAVDGLQAAISP